MLKSAHRIRLLLADDHTLFRQGIRSCLGRLKQFKIVGEAADGEDAVRKTKKLSPDVVLMDINMPRMNGLEATEHIRHESPHTRVLILTVHNNKEFVVQMIRSGARGYVLKDASLDDLTRAIEAVYHDEAFFSPQLAQYIMDEFAGKSLRLHESPPNELSEREKEVLNLIAEGKSSKEIALTLDLGLRTVQTYRERLMRKLDIHTVAGLTKYAMESGVLILGNRPSASRKPTARRVG